MAARRRMRMAELVRLSGVPRETIHYYLRERLLPPPERSGKTLSYYDESHLERLRTIRRLRDEKYLPVAVIRSIFEAGLEASSSSDLDALVDVLQIDPTLSEVEPSATAPDEETRRVAVELGLVDARSAESDDPSVRRVLRAVSESIGLEGVARELTLEDLRVSAAGVDRLVAQEARAFFDVVIKGGEMGAAIRALRAGRGAVARFIMAYRDLMLRRIIDELLSAIHGAAGRIQRARALPLGSELLARLEADAHRAELLGRAEQGDPAAANDLVWHLFAVGPAKEIARLPRSITDDLRPRAQLLVAHARTERNPSEAERMREILERAGAFALGSVLVAELGLLAALEPEGSAGVLERAVPALHRLFRAEPDKDADPLASALAHLRRGLVGLALPRALGREADAVRDLEQAIAVVLSAPGRLHPAARARIEGNARLALGRHRLAGDRSTEGAEQLARAREIDPSGPIGLAATAGASTAPAVEILAGFSRAG